MNKQNGLSTGNMLAIGASVAALAAASYYFWGPEGKKHQKDFKSWMIKMKADIIEKIENAGEITEDVYRKLVDEVAAVYAKTGKVSEEEALMYADLLKKQWRNIVKVAKKPARRIARKVTKKVVKKTMKNK